MRHTPGGDVEQNWGLRSGTLLVGLVIFGMALALLWGNVAWYELRQENLRLETELEQRENALKEMKITEDCDAALYQRAENMGLNLVDPAEVQVLHIRGRQAEP